MDHTALSARITDEFTTLAPQLQRTARYVLAHPDDVALMPMRRLADAAAVNLSTLARFATAFGFDRYAEFRAVFQSRLRRQPRGYVQRAEDIQATAEADLIAEVASAATDNIRKSIEGTSPARLVDAAQTLVSARRVYVVGGRSSFAVAYYLEYAMRMVRDDVVLLGDRGGTFGDSLRSLQAGDAVVAIGFDPYSGNTVRATTYAREKGAHIVALTDTPVSPLVKGAAHVLFVRNDGPAVFNTLSSVMAVAEALIALMVRAGGKAAVAAMNETEQQLRDFEAYWRKDAEQ